MKRFSLFVLGTVLFLGFGTHAEARVIYVESGSSNGTTGCGTGWGTSIACNSIQLAVDISVPGDEIWVKTGTYWENIRIERGNGDGVALYGGFSGSETQLEQRNWVTNPTTIDGDDESLTESLIILFKCDDPRTRVDGFILQNGKGSWDQIRILGPRRGGAIHINGYNSVDAPIITNNIIQNNATGYGGGIFFHWSGARIENNIIRNNLCGVGANPSYGGGIYAAGTYNEFPVISGNLVVEHTREGIFSSQSSPEGGAQGPSIQYNTIVGNNIGVMVDRFNGDLSNNIIAFNNGGFSFWSGVTTLNNNDLFGNTVRGDYLDKSLLQIDPTTIDPSYTDISVDPAFANTATDFSLAYDSPCIDAVFATTGPTADLNGNVRPTDGNLDGFSHFDIGAYEFAPVVHVAGITITTRKQGGQIIATADIQVLDSNNGPGSSIQLIGDWAGASQDNEYGITAGDGTISFESDPIKKPLVPFCFNVDVDSTQTANWPVVFDDLVSVLSGCSN